MRYVVEMFDAKPNSEWLLCFKCQSISDSLTVSLSCSDRGFVLWNGLDMFCLPYLHSVECI